MDNGRQTGRDWRDERNEGRHSEVYMVRIETFQKPGFREYRMMCNQDGALQKKAKKFPLVRIEPAMFHQHACSPGRARPILGVKRE